MSTDAITPYPCSLGTVIGHEGDSYVISTHDGRTIGIAANGECSPDNVEHDIANPPQVIATPADIAAHRWAVENGGVTVTLGGAAHRFDTTRENRAMWLALRLEATANPALSQSWKTLDGVFVELSAADVLTVCAAVYAHVAASFAAEAALLANPPTLGDLPAAFAALMP